MKQRLKQWISLNGFIVNVTIVYSEFYGFEKLCLCQQLFHKKSIYSWKCLGNVWIQYDFWHGICRSVWRSGKFHKKTCLLHWTRQTARILQESRKGLLKLVYNLYLFLWTFCLWTSKAFLVVMRASQRWHVYVKEPGKWILSTWFLTSLLQAHRWLHKPQKWPVSSRIRNLSKSSGHVISP